MLCISMKVWIIRFHSNCLSQIFYVCYLNTSNYLHTGEVEFFTDGGLLIRSRHLPSTYIRVSDVKSFHSYHTGLPNAVSILHLDLRPSFQLPPALMSSNKSTFAIAFYPHTSAWKNFSTTVSQQSYLIKLQLQVFILELNSRRIISATDTKNNVVL